MKLTPIQLREQAAQLRATGEHLAAVRLYQALLKRNPEDYRTRLHLADALAKVDATQAAVLVYRAVAELCIRGGRPLVALVACRAMEALGDVVDKLVQRLTQVYGQGSTSLAETGAGGLQVRHEDYQIDARELRSELTVEQLVKEALEVGTDLTQLRDLPGRVHPIPLLSELSPQRMMAVISTITVHRVPPGHVVFRQGSVGKSCFLVARGAVEVTTRKPGDDEQTSLNSLSDGAIFGEMSLITSSPRSATVVAIEEADLLEMGPESLSAIGEDLPRVAAALDRLAQRRWLSNLMRQSPIFSAFDEKERLELLKHFSANEVPQGSVLVPQGERPTGIYLILRGEVGMVRRVEGKPKTVVARRGPGGSIGLDTILEGRVAMASATTMTPATVLFLPEESVRRLIESVPGLVEAIRESAPPL